MPNKTKETDTYKKLKGKRQNNYPKYLIVHHTGGTDANPLADTSHHTAKIVENWHLAKGWDGIGYQYFIDKNGQIWIGRPEHRNGAHARGYNTKSIGICLAGNFDATEPTPAQIKSLTDLLYGLKAKYNIPDKRIIPHRNVAKKTCYGRNLTEDWARSLVAEKSEPQEYKYLADYSNAELMNELSRRLNK